MPDQKVTEVIVLPYDETDSVQCPNPLSLAGDEWTADSGEWDRWDVLPSVAALISFKQNPNDNAMPIPAGVITSFPVRARKIFYRLAVTAPAGQFIQVRLFRYKTPPRGD